MKHIPQSRNGRFDINFTGHLASVVEDWRNDHLTGLGRCSARHRKGGGDSSQAMHGEGSRLTEHGEKKHGEKKHGELHRGL